MDPPQTTTGSDAASARRLLIADDDPVVRSMLSMSLGDEFEIVGAAADSEQAVEMAAATQPHAALIDVDMPKGGGPHAVRGIARVSPATAIVVLSADESDRMVVDLLQAGAVCYRRKGLPAHALARTLADSIAAHVGEQSDRPRT